MGNKTGDGMVMQLCEAEMGKFSSMKMAALLPFNVKSCKLKSPRIPAA